jgi:hypothetical protein
MYALIILTQIVYDDGCHCSHNGNGIFAMPLVFFLIRVRVMLMTMVSFTVPLILLLVGVFISHFDNNGISLRYELS